MKPDALMKNLTARGFRVCRFATAEEATAYLNSEIDGATVAFGGSVSLSQMNLFPALQTHNTVYWHNDPAQVERYGVAALRELAMHAEVYLSSVNAMTEAGQSVNIDGTGNRISSIAYGHKRVYLVVGMNKVVPTMDAAIDRARNVAAPKNAQRLNRRTPCAVRGDRCYDCSSPDRICNGFLILEHAMSGQTTTVILVDEALGY